MLDVRNVLFLPAIPAHSLQLVFNVVFDFHFLLSPVPLTVRIGIRTDTQETAKRMANVVVAAKPLSLLFLSF